MTTELTNKQVLQILQQAVGKAKKNGYQDENKVMELEESDMNLFLLKNMGTSYDIMNDIKDNLESMCDKVIFSDKFAEAFWGNEILHSTGKGYKLKGANRPPCDEKKYYWKCHVENMRKDEEPLKYIEKYL